MPEFTYTARTKEGDVVSDTVESPSREFLGQSLRSKGLLPTSIIEKRRGRSFVNLNFRKLFSRVSLLEKLTFLKNLSVTLKAGLPAAKALNVLSRQTPNAYFGQVISEIAHNVEGGKPLSESMAGYTRIFSPIIINMVKVGEQSGELEKTLQYLSRQLERDYNLLRRTRGALIYPAVVLFALIVIGYLMFTFVLPRLTASFKEFNAELPFLTVLIIKTVDVFSNYSLLVLAGTVALGVSSWFWARTAGGRRALHKLILTLPIVKNIIKKLNLARFTIIFSGLLKSGMPIVEAIKITSHTMTNIYYQEALASASEKVSIGVDLVAALEKYPKLFTPMVTQMIQVGEESGTLEQVLEEVANFYEADIDETVKNLSSIIEPVLVLVMGAIVGVLAVGLILPIYNITQSL